MQTPKSDLEEVMGIIPKSLAHYKDCVLSPGMYHFTHTPLLIEGYHSLIAAFSECTHGFRIFIDIELQITIIKQLEKAGEMNYL